MTKIVLILSRVFFISSWLLMVVYCLVSFNKNKDGVPVRLLDLGFDANGKITSIKQAIAHDSGHLVLHGEAFEFNYQSGEVRWKYLVSGEEILDRMLATTGYVKDSNVLMELIPNSEQRGQDIYTVNREYFRLIPKPFEWIFVDH